jgi:hypothetical protein
MGIASLDPSYVGIFCQLFRDIGFLGFYELGIASLHPSYGSYGSGAEFLFHAATPVGRLVCQSVAC